MEDARAVHALDTIELDVGSGGRPGNERKRPALPDGPVEPSYRFRDEPHDLILADDADVQIRNEAERPPTLPRAGVEDEGANLGDGDGAACERPVERIQLLH